MVLGEDGEVSAFKCANDKTALEKAAATGEVYSGGKVQRASYFIQRS